MIKLLSLALIALSVTANHAEACGISLVMKGMWTVSCGGVLISQHQRYGKAIIAVVNQNADCDIIPPDRVEVRLSTPRPEPEPDPKELHSILVSWGKPTVKEDGSALTTIDRFNIYYDLDGVLQDVIEVEADSFVYTLANIQEGSYSFRVSTISEGVEGKKSEAVTVQVTN